MGDPIGSSQPVPGELPGPLARVADLAEKLAILENRLPATRVGLSVIDNRVVVQGIALELHRPPYCSAGLVVDRPSAVEWDRHA